MTKGDNFTENSEKLHLINFQSNIKVTAKIVNFFLNCYLSYLFMKHECIENDDLFYTTVKSIMQLMLDPTPLF